MAEATFWVRCRVSKDVELLSELSFLPIALSGPEMRWVGYVNFCSVEGLFISVLRHPAARREAFRDPNQTVEWPDTDRLLDHDAWRLGIDPVRRAHARPIKHNLALLGSMQRVCPSCARGEPLTRSGRILIQAAHVSRK